jgi:hypothetical protein
MFASCRAMKFGPAALVVMAMLAGMPTVSCAATGSVRISITRAQFIVGSGSGTLRFQGERYPLSVGGISAGPFGSARIDLVGRAYNMQTAASIHGVYTAVVADGAGTRLAGTFRLRNWRGVVLELRGRQGVKPSVDLSGLQISLR